ncbi:dipeptide epimerase [Robiginitalea sp. M366]|uniref:dipeptide epimerase n=1 Tax=Robiginitalea aestuariiviva TaxID=3036903 RepID=UPI00240DE4CB|nr:dipeptide epimerase [Robiginitalea aestuariiviva]MDG1573390.1 dipeptide epimerase [Robiginitalea aestuariiviva]
MELYTKTFTLELAHSFGISRERYDTQETLIAALSDGTHTGFGEATTNPYYGVTLPAMLSEMEAARPAIRNFSGGSPEDFHTLLCTLPISPFSRCALDLAYNDLYGKQKGQPLWQLWGTTLDRLPVSNYTIGLDTPEVMVSKMLEKPWPVYKIKLGTQADVALVTELRRHTDAVFRVDANCAWTAQETIDNSHALKELGVEFIEQPLPADAWDAMERVQHASVLPIMADESCIVEADVARCALHFSGINIKLTKCGGLTPARRMIREARSLGLKVMVGCMTESTVGISAIAQLLPQLDYVDMDGAMLLRSDIATGVRFTDAAEIVYPEGNGSGVAMLEPFTPVP